MEEAQTNFQFALYPPSQALRDYCHTLYTLECDADGIEDIVPAYSPQLLLFARGQAEITFSGGWMDRSSTASIVSQIEEAAHYRLHGPGRLLGVSLTIPGWIALGGPSMEGRANRMRPVADVFGAALADKLDEIRLRIAEDSSDTAKAAREVGDVVLRAVTPLSQEQKRFVTAVVDWLESSFDPQLADLHAALPVSPRQIQRLARRYFGRAPSSLAKRRRAVRAASLLASPVLAQELEDEIFAAYFDQAHLIREIRKYTGRTPKRLEVDELSPGVECLTSLDRSNDVLFDRLTGADAAPGRSA